MRSLRRLTIEVALACAIVFVAERLARRDWRQYLVRWKAKSLESELDDFVRRTR